MQIRDTIPNISALSEWSGLDLRHLAALEAIAREGSVSRAAAQLGYTQSAVSQQLRALERIVGVTLVTRSPGVRSIELTEAGRQLLGHADAIAGHLETARADLAAFSDGRTGELRIGAVPSVAAALDPRARRGPARARAAARAARDASRTSRRSCSTASPRASSTWSIAPEDEPRDGLESEEIMRDPYVLLVPAGDPLARLGAAADAGRPRRARPDRQGLRHREPARAHAPRSPDYGLAEPRIRAHDLREVQALVRRGLGIAVVPRLLLDEPEPDDRAAPGRPPRARPRASR